MKNKVWIKDSAVIYEFRFENGSYGSIAEGKIVKINYPLAGYFYIDLRNRICQVYENLKDTAVPRASFELKERDGNPFWRLYHLKNQLPENTAQIKLLPDTAIEGISYKRVAIPDKNTGSWFVVYYLKPSKEKNIIHINRALEQMYPGYKAYRTELLLSEKNFTRDIFEYKIINDSLTGTEERIFNKWGENATNINLPVVSFEQMMMLVNFNLKYDQEPLIAILPRDTTIIKRNPTTKVTANNIKQWLQKKLDPGTPYKNRLIKKVLENAVFDKMYAESLENKKENLIIVPLKNDHVSQYIPKNNPPLQYLLLVENEQGEIRRGDIILYYSPNKLPNALPENTFYNLFNSDFNSPDGTYALISLRDVKQWEMDFKNHEKTEFRLWHSIQNPDRNDLNCSSWYVKITRYLNGRIEQDKKYLGETCSGCPPNHVCDLKE